MISRHFSVSLWPFSPADHPHTALRPAVQPPARSRHGTPARGLDHSMVCPLALPPHQHPRVPISSASVFQSLQAHETAAGPATCRTCSSIPVPRRWEARNHCWEPSLLPQHGWPWPGRVPEPRGPCYSPRVLQAEGSRRLDLILLFQPLPPAVLAERGSSHQICS